MSKHTPGPWKAVHYSQPPYTDANCRIYGARDEWIATVQTNGEANDSDARLIAAAPELLEMVRRFGVGDMRLPHTEYEMALRAEARALLARIEEST